MGAIPEREPYAEMFMGALLRVDAHHALAAQSLDEAETLAEGDLILRYAVEYLGKPHLAIVPGLVALDYGEMLVSERAFNFILHQSNLHPRADVLGYRNDGEDDMISVKWLDREATPHVLVYADLDATTPLATVEALIVPPDVELTERLERYLPRHENLSDWLTSP